METLRPASILPAIKCSSCGAEIEISSMGEHICAPSQEKMADPSPHGGYDTQYSDPPGSPVTRNIPFGSPPQSIHQNMPINTEKPQLRPPRTAPPRIDAQVANKPYTQRDLLTPNGHGPFTPRSPMTPRSASRPSLRSPPTRSMTSPMPRIYRPPSPQMSSNLDCAFPPFPTGRSASNPKPKSPMTSTRGGGSHAFGSTLHAEPESYIGPRSPRTTGGAHVMQRMNTIAPGPFDARRRASSDQGTAARRSPTPRSTEDSTSAAATEPADALEEPKSPIVDSPQSSSPISSSPPAFVAVAPPTNREGRPVPQRPVRPEPLDGFLAMLKNETDSPTGSSAAQSDPPRPESRSNASILSSSPPEQRGNMAIRRPSEPGPRIRRPTLTGPSTSAPSSLPNTSEPIPRESSDHEGVVPPLPPLSTIQAHSYQSTVHSPSDSASSTSSTRSYGGLSFRSDMSPPVSANSSVSMLSTTLGEMSRDPELNLAVPNLQVRSKLSQTQLRPDEPEPVPVVSSREDLAAQTPISPVSRQLEPSAIPIITQSEERRSPSPSQFPPPSGSLPLLPSSPVDSISRTPTNKFSGKRPGTVTKHHCRGCKEPIVGKSVKAADGRLTGRYHKQCFVCRTCHSAFATADFYVMNNDPYCEQHYHQLNNSLCAKCDRGIEGTYLETQQGQKKFHLDCFTCLDCHKVLSDDYFEIGGAVYCEQHAFTELRRQEGLGPKRNMERRTTRLMMMGPVNH